MALNKTRRNRIILFSVAVIMLSAISYLVAILPSDDYRLISGDKIDLNSGWTVQYDDTILNDVNLPYDLKLDENTKYTASLTLPSDLDNHIRLRIRSSMQDIVVYVDGNEIFRDIKDKGSRFEVPDASIWHIFELPNDIEGKELRIEMVSPTKAFSGVLNEVYAGQGKDLIFDIVISNIFKLVLFILFFSFGILTIGVSGVFKNLEDNRLIYLGSFAIFVAVWIFTESKIMQFFIGNRFILGGLSYMMIPLIAISFVLFLKESVLQKYKSVMVAFAVIFFVNLIANIYLQLAGIANFISSMRETVILIVLIIAASIFFMVLEWKKYDNHQAKNMLIYSSISSVFLLIEILIFLMGRYEMTGYFTGAGILIFFAQISYNTFKYMNNMIQVEKESEILKKLAYKDILTNMGNRAAFERYIDSLREYSGKVFRLVMMDINNLKYINDNFGHKEGDDAIKSCSSAIKKYLKPHGECFRLGGDEFACIIFDLDDLSYQKKIDTMRGELNASKPDQGYVLDIAIGSDIYDYDKYNDISDFIHETDLKMYSNKKRIKGH